MLYVASQFVGDVYHVQYVDASVAVGVCESVPVCVTNFAVEGFADQYQVKYVDDSVAAHVAFFRFRLSNVSVYPSDVIECSVSAVARVVACVDS